MTERIAIVGARDASPETLEKVRAYVRALPEGTIVVSGGAVGVDRTAEGAAKERGLRVVSYRVQQGPDREGQGREIWIEENDKFVIGLGTRSFRDALIFRNTLIAIRCDRAAAFTQGSKGGSLDCVKQFDRFQRPVERP